MRVISNIHRWPLAFLMLTLIVTGCISDDEWEGVGQGAIVPEFCLQAEDGTTVSDASLKGKIYLLTFFNTECKDCQHELPVIQKIYDAYRYDITFVNIARNEGEDDIADYWKANGLTMPYYAQTSSELFSRFATSGIPRVYLVDNNGVIRASFDDSNMPDYATLASLIDKCMDDSGLYHEVTIKACVKAPNQAQRDNDLYYFYNEYAINNLYGYFFDAETKKLEKVVHIDNLTKQEDLGDKTYDISYLAETIKLRSSNYDVFCIANTTTPPEDITDEEEFLNLQDDVSYHSGILPSIDDNGAIMTSNASEYRNINFGAAVKSHTTMTINLERVMAKVHIGIDDEVFNLSHNGETYAMIHLTNYCFVNLNTTFYLFRHTINNDKETKPQHFTLDENFATDEVGYEYVIDPLFYKKSSNTIAYNLIAQQYAYPFKDFDDNNMASLPAVGSYGAAYILENTCYKTSQKNAYSTGVIFKGSVTPAFVYLFDGVTGTLKEEKRMEYWPTKLYFYDFNFYGSLRALNIDSKLNLDELKTYSDIELAQYGVKQVNFNIGVYETYYTYWIRERNEAEGLAPMKYGIVRNHHYLLKVAGVSGIGNSVITPDLKRDNEPNSYSDISVSSDTK